MLQFWKNCYNNNAILQQIIGSSKKQDKTPAFIWIFMIMYTAISRKVVGKSARDNSERYCGWFWAHCCSKKFERRAGEAMDICLWVLKESNEGRFDGYCVRNSVLIISHVTFRDCRVHIVSYNLSQNSCSWQKLCTWVLCFLGDWKTMLKI